MAPTQLYIQSINDIFLLHQNPALAHVVLRQNRRLLSAVSDLSLSRSVTVSQPQQKQEQKALKKSKRSLKVKDTAADVAPADVAPADVAPAEAQVPAQVPAQVDAAPAEAQADTSAQVDVSAAAVDASDDVDADDSSDSVSDDGANDSDDEADETASDTSAALAKITDLLSRYSKISIDNSDPDNIKLTLEQSNGETVTVSAPTSKRADDLDSRLAAVEKLV